MLRRLEQAEVDGAGRLRILRQVDVGGERSELSDGQLQPVETPLLGPQALRDRLDEVRGWLPGEALGGELGIAGVEASAVPVDGTPVGPS